MTSPFDSIGVPLPDWVLELVSAPKQKAPRDEVPACELDTAGAILAAIHYAEMAEPAVEGSGGDDCTFRVACKMRDLGVSDYTCLEILLDKWNDRCSPPWSCEDLQTKVENAYQYARGQAGALSPAAITGQFQMERSNKGIRASEVLAMEVPKTRWAVEGLFPAGLTVIGGKPKIGKSWFALQLGIAVATGGPFLGHQAIRGESIYLALEDGLQRIQERLKCILSSGEPAPYDLTFLNTWAPTDKGGFEALETLFSEKPDLRLAIIDVWQKIRPLSKPKGATAYEVDYAEAAKLKRLADRYQVALILITHLRKAGKGIECDAFEQISGSTGITGAADVICVLSRFRNVADAEFHITGRDVEEAQIALIRDRDTCRWECIGSTENIQKTPERQKILDALKTLKSATPTSIAESTGLRTQYVKNTLPKLLRDGMVVRTKHGHWAVCANGDPDSVDFL